MMKNQLAMKVELLDEKRGKLLDVYQVDVFFSQGTRRHIPVTLNGYEKDATRWSCKFT